MLFSFYFDAYSLAILMLFLCHPPSIPIPNGIAILNDRPFDREALLPKPLKKFQN